MTTIPDPATAPGPLTDSAVNAAIKAAFLANPVVAEVGDSKLILVPNGFTLKQAADPEYLSDVIRTDLRFDDPESLVDYCNRFAGEYSVLFADLDAARVMAVIDWHSSCGLANYCRHRATLGLRASEEFTRWAQFVAAGQMPQADFARFLEENSADVAFPEAAALLEIARDIEGVQEVRFGSATRLQSGDRAFRYETETRTRGEMVIPERFTISVPFWLGTQPQTLTLLLRYRVKDGGLTLGVAWHRMEMVRFAAWREMVTALAEATGLPVYHGRLPE